ncbi:MAG: histidinol dehydrogenase, partial [Rhizobiales bacterium]|nr:histidinol dehydrogenase [Hyphomicrobiales bacterium]
MAIRLDFRDSDFEARFTALLATKREVSEDVDHAVRAILADVRARGDAAVIDYTKRFDRLELTAATMRVSETEFEAAESQVDAATRAALVLARDRIRSHHQRQKPADDRYTDALGVELGSRWTAIG